jgi:hypothetical protein
MSLTIPKPVILVLTKPMTPPWVLALVIATQFVFSQTGSQPGPSCSLEFENLHYSTSVKRSAGIYSIKMNLKSICTAPQRESRIRAVIQVLRNGQSEIFYKSPLTTSKADSNNPYEATFLQFWQTCKKGETLWLRGEAHGVAILRSNEEVQLTGNTREFTPVFCDFPAK